jgi:hypothetical protein
MRVHRNFTGATTLRNNATNHVTMARSSILKLLKINLQDSSITPLAAFLRSLDEDYTD